MKEYCWKPNKSPFRFSPYSWDLYIKYDGEVVGDVIKTSKNNFLSTMFKNSILGNKHVALFVSLDAAQTHLMRWVENRERTYNEKTRKET